MALQLRTDHEVAKMQIISSQPNTLSQQNMNIQTQDQESKTQKPVTRMLLHLSNSQILVIILSQLMKKIKCLLMLIIKQRQFIMSIQIWLLLIKEDERMDQITLQDLQIKSKNTCILILCRINFMGMERKIDAFFWISKVLNTQMTLHWHLRLYLNETHCE